MNMHVPWTVYYTSPSGEHVVKNVLAPSALPSWGSARIKDKLAIDGSVLFLTKGHHKEITFGVGE